MTSEHSKLDRSEFGRWTRKQEKRKVHETGGGRHKNTKHKQDKTQRLSCIASHRIAILLKLLIDLDRIHSFIRLHEENETVDENKLLYCKDFAGIIHSVGYRHHLGCTAFDRDSSLPGRSVDCIEYCWIRCTDDDANH